MSKFWYHEEDDDNIVWLHFDTKGSSTNLLSSAALDELVQQLDEIAHLQPSGLVLVSDKASGFSAGADVHEFGRIANVEMAREHITKAQAIYTKLEEFTCPTVAVIHGFCMGGGLELVLSCRYRIARDDIKTRMGFPEVRLGMFPGYGGTVRSIEKLGPAKAMDLMLTGRNVVGRSAKRLGLVDLVLPDRQLHRGAQHLISKQPPAVTPGWQKHLNNPWIRPLLAAYLKHSVSKKVNEAHYPAPFALIDHWREHGGNREALFTSEAEQDAKLLFSSTSTNLRRVFSLQEKLRGLGKDVGFKPKTVHVVGAGTMGGDIAAWCALKGMNVTLQDRDPESLSRALGRAHALFKKKLKKHHVVQAAWDRLIPDHKGYGLAKADVIIEAIFEDPAVKQALFKDLEAKVKPDALLASNTSSIPLKIMGEKMQRPERLVGLHFFNPVAKMQLIEVVNDEHTDKQAILDASAFAAQIGRRPLPVKSRPGFLVNRVLMPYLMEAVTLLDEGVPGIVIDKLATDFGMPMGPVELADTVGLDICLSVAEKLGTPESDLPLILKNHVKSGQLGKKTGQGFYSWAKGRPVKPATKKDDSLADDTTDRMMLRMLNESVACLHEGIIEDADLMDAGIIFGTGFAPFHGGPTQYMRSEGFEKMHQRLALLEKRYGPRFAANDGWAALIEVP